MLKLAVLVRDFGEAELDGDADCEGVMLPCVALAEAEGEKESEADPEPASDCEADAVRDGLSENDPEAECDFECEPADALPVIGSLRLSVKDGEHEKDFVSEGVRLRLAEYVSDLL